MVNQTIEQLLQEAIDQSMAQTQESRELAEEVAGKMAEIDKKADDVVDRVDAAIPTAISTELCPTIYLHPDTGDDANSGLSKSSAVKTLGAAAGKIPMGGRGIIVLAAKGLYIPLDHTVTLDRKSIRIHMDGATLEQKTYGTNSIGVFRPINGWGEILIYGGTLKTAMFDEKVGSASSDRSLVTRTDTTTVSLKTMQTTVQIGDQMLISYGNYANGHSELSIGHASLSFQDGVVDKKLASLANSGTLSLSMGGTSMPGGESMSDLILGIIRAADGEPRNIITNISSL
ncbi:hypothetical protein KI655_23570 [Vibrio sp. D404a]|nr:MULTISPECIES: hypothetical protein [unclassified Vibrio]MDK9740284.1 hypothetical protein [Vibrio sp. D404a]MDK9797054.1 hypothetical protein [Vibrio sp. D449a]